MERVVLCFVSGVSNEVATSQEWLSTGGNVRARVFGARDDAKKRDALDVVLSVRPPWEIDEYEEKKTQPCSGKPRPMGSLKDLAPFLVSKDQMQRKQNGVEGRYLQVVDFGFGFEIELRRPHLIESQRAIERTRPSTQEARFTRRVNVILGYVTVLQPD